MSLLVYEPPGEIGIEALEDELARAFEVLRAGVDRGCRSRRAAALDRAPRGAGRGERRGGAPGSRAAREGGGLGAAIVTGAGGAIGRAIARRFRDGGRPVIRVDRDERVREICDELGQAVPCVVDLAAEDAPERVLDAADRAGGAGVLVNNAGITRDGRALKLALEDFRLVIRVNLIAPLRLAEAVGPRLADGGAIVNTCGGRSVGG